MMALYPSAKEPLAGQKQPDHGSGHESWKIVRTPTGVRRRFPTPLSTPPMMRRCPFDLGAQEGLTSAALGSGNAPGDVGVGLRDPQGQPLFDPEGLCNLHSEEWEPPTHITNYLELRMRTPLSKEGRQRLRAECPGPNVPNEACRTPEVDPTISQFLGKTGWKPKKGLEFSLKNCQDKILKVTGPASNLYELLESAKAGETAMDFDVAIGWVQRLICLLGNANTAMATERRKAILLKIDIDD
ncbi:Hypothetical predicted protein [Pelobates cultripes]|uniref:Uncharacterized protein n=1 Tax=Pelobates cultripes TaxID=61616 RepID=A0AAD1SPR8_PELCU|nr:Hypothetical predicted protein [Pelobates cultripes]